MSVHVAYGEEGIDLELDREVDATILRSAQPVALDDPRDAILQALRDPIEAAPLAQTAGELVRRRDEAGGLRVRVGIVVNDITRATPNEVILPVLVDELLRAGIDPGEITIFNATGTHRDNTPEELERMLGAQTAARFPVVQNDCTNDEVYTDLGTTPAGNRVRVLTRFLEQDLRIATGFIEPHFFAGYSGGGKAVVPGLAHLDTILFNHSPDHMDDVDATWGKTTGNPLWEDLAHAADLVGPLFLLNVAMNSAKEITGVFAGERGAAHAAGCSEVARHAIVSVDAPADIVVTSNSGYPLDQNFYQAVKGMSAAARVVKEGGQIIIAAECRDGIPAHGLFAQLLNDASSAESLLETLHRPEYRVRDAWQAHIFAKIRSKARVTLVSRGLPTDDLPPGLVDQERDLASAVQAAVARVRSEGREPTVFVLPDGPLTIPTLASSTPD